MSKKKVDITRTDPEYWSAVLAAEGLGMNRGTTFSEEDKLATRFEKVIKKAKLGRPRKTGPKGSHKNLTKLEATAATRYTFISNETSGIFQFGGIKHYGPSLPFGAGSGKKGGKKGPEGRRDFISYVGNAYDLARLEESLSRDEDGRVRPSGFGPDR